jgi:ketosteroid isomerase-like protein
MKEIEDEIAKFSEYWSQKNWESFSNYFTDNSEIWVTNSPQVKGRKNAVGVYVKMWTMLNFEKAYLETIETRLFQDNSVYERGHYTFYSKDGEVLDEGKYIALWEKVLNEWKVQIDAPTTNVKDVELIKISEQEMVNFIKDAYKLWVETIDVNYLEKIITDEFLCIWSDGTKSNRKEYIEKFKHLQNEQKKFHYTLGNIRRINGNTALYDRKLELFTAEGQSVSKQDHYVLMSFDSVQKKIRKVQLFDGKDSIANFLKSSSYPSLKEEL